MCIMKSEVKGMKAYTCTCILYQEKIIRNKVTCVNNEYEKTVYLW